MKALLIALLLIPSIPLLAQDETPEKKWNFGVDP